MRTDRRLFSFRSVFLCADRISAWGAGRFAIKTAGPRKTAISSWLIA
ncbi:hypothetical protein SAMN06265222_103265 [Neorhodopirellula lusitana]|uniref:Uncharacterized protein n=1 Tax=Neorhodopirellula lusitana TaxID=445327 RepID=A0ABY1PXS0_9BACT|nr:hypothetical protein SAMN06265222_103265 [Neorhodopirellula lusitana]